MTTVNGPEVARANPGTAVGAFQILAELKPTGAGGAVEPLNKARAAAGGVTGQKRSGPVFIVEPESSIMTM